MSAASQKLISSKNSRPTHRNGRSRLHHDESGIRWQGWQEDLRSVWPESLAHLRTQRRDRHDRVDVPGASASTVPRRRLTIMRPRGSESPSRSSQTRTRPTTFQTCGKRCAASGSSPPLAPFTNWPILTEDADRFVLPADVEVSSLPVRAVRGLTPFDLALAARLAFRWSAQCLLRHLSSSRLSFSTPRHCLDEGNRKTGNRPDTRCPGVRPNHLRLRRAVAR